MCADKTDIAHSVDRDAGLLFDRALIADARPALLRPEHWQAEAEHARGGRGGVWMVSGEFGAGVLRHYHRGGLAARVSRDTYLWRGSERTRSFAEFRLLLRLRELGLPVPRPIIAGYRRVSWLGYQADLLMSRIEHAFSLAEYLQQGKAEQDVLVRLGETLARFHQVGLDHADLNAHNLLLDQAGCWWVIDLDRGRLRRRGAWVAQRLQRLKRSMRKILATDPQRADHCWAVLNGAHDQALPGLGSAAPG